MRNASSRHDAMNKGRLCGPCCFRCAMCAVLRLRRRLQIDRRVVRGFVRGRRRGLVRDVVRGAVVGECGRLRRIQALRGVATHDAAIHERHAHDEPRAAFGRIFVMHAAAMQRHDVVHDREAEARAAIDAALALTVAAEEALEQIGLLRVRHAAAIVLDDDFGHRQTLGERLRNGDRDAAAVGARGRQILERVVEQIGDHFVQQHGIAAHHQRRVVLRIVETLEAQVDVARERARHPLGARFERERSHVDIDETRRLFARLRAREREQLIREPHRAVGGGAQLAHGVADLLRLACVDGLFGVQLHGGQRRAQLMRGVGDEFALTFERGFQAAEQGVQRARERTDLDGHEGLVDGFERGVRLAVERIGEIGQRIELLVHHAPHDHPAREQQKQQRHHDRDEELGGDAEAMMHGLADFDHDRIAGGLRHAHLRDAHAHAVINGLEHVRVVHAAHVGALQRQIVVAGDFGFTVADAVDEVLDRIGEHGLRERRHRDGRFGTGDLDLFGDRSGQVGERAVDHMLRVLPREPIGDQAAHQREQRKWGGEAPQQRTPQARCGRKGHDRFGRKGSHRRGAWGAPGRPGPFYAGAAASGRVGPARPITGHAAGTDGTCASRGAPGSQGAAPAGAQTETIRRPADSGRKKTRCARMCGAAFFGGWPQAAWRISCSR
ncbi:hypothetical protein PT2222_10070 [Paraburkholderia tropica]